MVMLPPILVVTDGDEIINVFFESDSPFAQSFQFFVHRYWDDIEIEDLEYNRALDEVRVRRSHQKARLDEVQDFLEANPLLAKAHEDKVRRLFEIEEMISELEDQILKAANGLAPEIFNQYKCTGEMEFKVPFDGTVPMPDGGDLDVEGSLPVKVLRVGKRAA